MKKSFLFIIFSIFLGAWSAQANVCITETYQNSSYSSLENSYWESGYEIHKASFTCQELDNIDAGLQVASIAFAAGGIYAACTGVGLPATIALESGALVFSALSLVVSQLDCEDTESDELIKEKVDAAVCTALEAQGLNCIPPLQRVDDSFITL